MEYVLVATTRGDELIRSTQKVIATSDKRGHLEKLKQERAEEREKWLAANASAVPWWQECSIISDEQIVEVEKV